MVWDTRTDKPNFSIKDYKNGIHDSELKSRFELFEDKGYFPKERPEIAQALLNTLQLSRPAQYAILVLDISAEEGKTKMEEGKLGGYIARIIPGENLHQQLIILINPRR